MKRSEDDGVIHFQRLQPEHFDVVLGAHPARQKPAPRPNKPRSYGLWLLMLILAGMLGFMAFKRLEPQPIAESPQATPAPAPPEPVPTQPVAATVALRSEPSANLAPPVLGSTPAVAAAPQAKGMVSANYLADYHADLRTGSSPRKVPQGELATVAIREWDGRNRYEATWRIFNNLIDNSSVCANFHAASTEHRECRRAATVYFKEQCTEWSKRWNRDRDTPSKDMQQRYCTATETYRAAG